MRRHPTRPARPPRLASPARGLTVCVGEEYARLLANTLPRNMRLLSECLVVTTPDDEATRAVVDAVPGARLFPTTAFTAWGAVFNKGYAIERAFAHFERRGTMLIWDSDILLPPSIPYDQTYFGCIHGCTRRVLEDPSAWHEGLDWSTLPLADYLAPHGYFQLFSADDPVLRRQRPWYGVDSSHAGRGDHQFMTLWPPRRRKLLRLEALHLGRLTENWFGANDAGRAFMRAYGRPGTPDRVQIPASDPVYDINYR